MRKLSLTFCLVHNSVSKHQDLCWCKFVLRQLNVSTVYKYIQIVVSESLANAADPSGPKSSVLLSGPSDFIHFGHVFLSLIICYGADTASNSGMQMSSQ